MYKYTIPRFLRRITPAITWKVKTPDKAVYLTFDDGPHPQITPWVLGELAKFGGKGTFFCVGENVVKFPYTYQAILEAGHAVANHSFNHLNGWKTDNTTYFNNIEECHKEVGSRLFRPPYGRLTFSQYAYLKRKYEIVMWSILTRDYDQNLDTKEVMREIIKNISNGDVIVFHDSEKAEKNLKLLLPPLLQYLHESGYEMRAL
jgi:peptidoglycan/xylan/chitin deacetylase (PgdA/CDA1 family)